MDARVLAWLLEKDNPSVRHATLTTLLKRTQDDVEVQQAKSSIMSCGTVPRLLQTQHAGGYWGESAAFYTDKYGGTVWNVLLLAELGADGNDARVRSACEFLLANSQERTSGGFSTAESRKTAQGLKSLVIPCLTGNMVYALLRLGYWGDERLQKGIEWICTYQRSDDGEAGRPQGEMYERYAYCWGSHSCHMGVAKALKALAAIPPELRSDAVRAKIDELVDYFLKHHIYKKSHDLEKVSKPGWNRFGFPLMYQSDTLELLDIMASLHVQSPCLDEAIALVREKRRPDGTWVLENSFNGRTAVSIETKGKPSKWITLRALRSLNAYCP
jgi:hypothetical protein